MHALENHLCNIPNEQKKEYGQLVNEIKQAAEDRFQMFKEEFENLLNLFLRVNDQSIFLLLKRYNQRG